MGTIIGEVFTVAISEARHRANEKWNAKAYDDVRVRIPKGRKADVEAYAKQQGESVNGMINNYLRSVLNMSEDEWKRTSEEQLGDA